MAYRRYPAGLIGNRPLARSNISMIICSLFALILAFIPLFPAVNAIDGERTTLNGAIELALIGAGIALAALNVPDPAVTAAYLRLPAVTIGGGFAMWAMLTTAWSPNPILTAGKSLELGLIIVAAALVVRLSVGARWASRPSSSVAIPLATAFVLVILFLIAVNVLIWKTPLPFETGEDVLAYGEVDAAATRPRLFFAYAHPLLIGDLFALMIICIISSDAPRAVKAVSCPLALLGIWMTDSRTSLVVTPLILTLMAINRLKKRETRLIMILLIIFLLLALLALAAGGGGGTGAAMDPKTEKDIYTLDGRTELWWDVVLLVQENWCTGVGFYASRYFLMNTWPWAGHTHNSFLEVALGTGVVGLVICTLFVGHVVRAIWRTRDGLLLGTAAYCMIVGNTNPIMFYPGLHMFVLMVALIGSSPRRP